MEEYDGANDDIFYDDLKRWILSLMMDDEEADGSEEERKSPTTTAGIGYKPPFSFLARNSIDGFSKEIPKCESSSSGPNVHGIPLFFTEDPNMLNIWSFGWLNRKESGTGTGVFIPRSPKYRRKPRAKRKINH